MTPEKLDILSRKVKENSQLIELIKLLIFDEVGLNEFLIFNFTDSFDN